jgi:uncharacterized protein with ParB-like and HNH nuclease domain
MSIYFSTTVNYYGLFFERNLPDSKTPGNNLYVKRFLIPDYQRSYSWGKEKCEVLLDDILSGGTMCPLFVGATILKDKGNQTYDIVYGQQRMLTFTLFFAAMRDAIIDIGKELNIDLKKKSDEFAGKLVDISSQNSYLEPGHSLKASDFHSAFIEFEPGLSNYNKIFSFQTRGKEDLKNVRSNYLYFMTA